MRQLLYQKPVALQQLSTTCHGVIEASAGTGKTYTLQHLLVEILLERPGVRLDQILLVTFTVAATSDLKAKIRATLEELTRAWDEGRRRGLEEAVWRRGELTALTGEEDEDAHWCIDREGIDRLRQALRNFDRAAIYTIHGFCQRVLVEHAFANRRLFEQEHVSSDDVIDRAFAQMLRRDILAGTESEQWMKAYLGAGKSVDDLRDALGRFVRSNGEYRPGFQPQALSEAVADFVTDVERMGFDSWKEAATGHGRTLNTMADKHGATIYEALKDHASLSMPELLARLSSDASKGLKYLRGKSPQKVLAQGGPISAPLQAILDLQVSLDVAVVNILGERLQERLVELKDREGYFTFDDMVKVVRDTLIDGGAAGHLLESLRDQFHYGLIDEFQDTDQEQWEIFRRIFVDSERGDRHFLYLIGDPKQAIYGFRGGDVYTYLDACAALEEQGAIKTSLADNYRSTPAVLGAYNAIFEAEENSEISLGHRIKYEEGGVRPGKSWLNLRVNEKDSEVGLRLFEMVTDREEVNSGQLRQGVVDAFADEIHALVNGVERLSYPVDEAGEEWQEVGPGQIYVLCRRHHELDAMADALRRRGVDFAFFKKPGLFETAEAGDLYDLLLALDDPGDRSRRARAWQTPFFDLRLQDVERLEEEGGQSQPMQQLVRWSQIAKRGEYADLFETIFSESGIIRRRLVLDRGERGLTNSQHIAELLSAEAGVSRLSVRELAAKLKGYIDGRSSPDGDETDQQRVETEDAAVQLLTIHASKGLQRGVVFVIPRLSAISTRYPPFRYHEPQPSGDHLLVEWNDSVSRMPAGHKERFLEEAHAEELRLAYVALTRAELLVYAPWIDETFPDSSRSGIRKDPFHAIMERLSGLRGDGRIEFRQVLMDSGTNEIDGAAVEAGLEAVEIPDSLWEAGELDEEVRLEQRRQLMQRRWEITSYSKLKQRSSRAFTEYERGDDDAATGLLPGGMGTGNFLHQVMEDLDYTLVAERTLKEWLEDEELQAFFKARGRRFGRYDELAIEEAMRLVYGTLKAPVQLCEDHLLDGLWRLEQDRVRREMEFLFPVPERHSIDGEEVWQFIFESGADVRGGFVTGIVDLLFFWEGKVYFADWKSDRAHPFDEEALSRLVEDRYATQATLYSLALCRMMGIVDQAAYDEHFGGYFYFFLRGMTPEQPGRGIYGDKVPWDRLEAYERRLRSAVNEAKLEGLR